MKSLICLFVFLLSSSFVFAQSIVDTVEVGATSVYRMVNGIDRSTYWANVSGGELMNDSPIEPVKTIKWGEVPGVYFLKVVERSAGGCLGDTSTIWVRVIKKGSDVDFVSVPNVFTPNGDGINDRLQITASSNVNIHLDIYSRWGVKIFESNAVSDSWDGTYNKQLCASGAYFYILKLTSGALEKTKKGFVMLER